MTIAALSQYNGKENDYRRSGLNAGSMYLYAANIHPKEGLWLWLSWVIRGTGPIWSSDPP